MLSHYMGEDPKAAASDPEARAKLTRGFLGVLFLVCLLASFAFGFQPKAQPIQVGIDSAYVYGASYASDRGWRWGMEFVSTYGPYAYFMRAAEVGTMPAKRWASEILLVALIAAACAFHAAAGPATTRGGAAVAAVLLVYASQLQGPEERWFVLVLLLLLLSLHGRGRLRTWSFSFAALAAGFFLLVKLSLGFGTLLTLFTGSLLSGGPRAMTHRLALLGLGAGSALFMGWLAYHGSWSGIGEFLAASWSVTSGYSSAMSLAPEGWEATALSFAYFAAVLGVWSLSTGRRRPRRTFLACIAPLFFTWKHMMVRQDEGHVADSILFGVFFLALFWHESLAASRGSRAALVAASLPALFAPWFLPQAGDVKRTPRRLVLALAAPVLGRPTPEPPKIDGLRLGKQMRESVGDAPVDVYPFETAYIAANDLLWRNRPSPYSFASYTPRLDGRNARFFSSPRRPRFLLWHMETHVYSIDGRHLFWDEPETLRALLGTYRLIASGGAFLLEDRGEPLLSDPRPLGLVEVRWGEWIPVPDTGGALLASVHFERPLGASLRRLLLREDPMFVSLRFESGGDRVYRCLPDQAGSGLWMSPLPRTVEELRLLLRGNFSGPRPRAIRFHGAWGSSARPPFLLTWLQVTPRPRT